MKNKILAYAIGPVMASVIGLVTTPLLTWVIDPEDMGRLSIFHLLSSIATLVITLGLDQYFMRNYYKDKSLVAVCYYLGLVFLSILSCVVFVYGNNLESLLFNYKSGFPYIISIMVLNYFLIITSRYTTLFLRMDGKAVEFSISQILTKTSILFLFSLAYFLKFEIDFIDIVIIYTFSTLVTLLYSSCKGGFFQVLFKAKLRKQTEFILDGIKFGTPLVVSGIAFWLLTGLDKIMLKEYANLSELAIYSVAVSFSSFAVIVKSVFSTIWMPTIYKSEKEDSLVETKKIIDNVIPKITFLVLIVFCLVGLFSPFVKFFLPHHYSGVSILVVICCGYPLFYTLSESSSAGLYIKKKTYLVSIITVTVLLVNFTLNYYLIPKLGANGAGISTIVSFYIYYILRSELSTRIWVNTRNIKSYIYCFITMLISLYNGELTELALSTFIWASWMCIIFYSYKEEIIDLMTMVKTRKQ